MSGKKGPRGRIRGTKAREENERFRCEIKGADCAKGENKMHDREKCEAGIERITGEIKGTKVKDEHLGSQGKTKSAASAQGEGKMREGAKKMSR